MQKVKQLPMNPLAGFGAKATAGASRQGFSLAEDKIKYGPAGMRVTKKKAVAP